MIRILQVVPSDLGWELRFQAGLIRRVLRNRDCRIELFEGPTGTSADPPSLRDATAELTNGLHPFRDYGLYRDLSRSVQRDKPDILHTYGFKGLLLGSVVARRRDVPAIVNTYDGDWSLNDNPRYDSFFRSRVARFFVRNYDALISVSRTVEFETRAPGFGSDDKWRVVPPGAEIERFRRIEGRRGKLRERLGLSETDFLVGCVDAFQAGARLSDLMAVVQKTGAERPNIYYLLMTANDPSHPPPALFRKIGLETGVHLLDPKTDSLDLYADVDFALSLSSQAAFPRSSIESLAAGVPSLAANVGANAEFLDSPEWLSGTYEGGDVEDLLVSLYHVHDHREEFARVARETKECVIQEYDLPTFAANYESLYRGLVARKGIGG